MISFHELEAHYQFLPAGLLEIVVELRNLVMEVAPEACEEVRAQGLVYYHAERGGPVSAGICQILIQPDHIRLGIQSRSFLPDPTHLLEGSQL